MMQNKGPILTICCLMLAGLTACISSQEIVPTAISIVPTASPVSSREDANIVLYRGNMQRTGVYDVPAIREEPAVKWESKIGTTWLMPGLVAHGVLYTGSGNGILYAVDVETGEELWSVEGFSQLESTGALAEDVIVTGGYSQVLKAIDRMSGDERWSFKTDYSVQAAALIVDSQVYIAKDRMVYALDLDSGELLWKLATGKDGAFMGGPAYEDGTLYTTVPNSCLRSMRNLAS